MIDHQIPSTVPAGGSVASRFIPAVPSMRELTCVSISVSLTSSAPVTVAIQRYMDSTKTIKVGDATSDTTTAATPFTASIVGSIPCGGFEVTVSNAGGSAVTLTNVGVMVSGR